ncbi:MAG: D-alanine--D-alanine ligase [Defluviitaleaceae bacterium]|nr:D-alanine--D-alanine ligase [Defluviitaleaceae bacterium]
MEKKNILVLFGGVSPEHDISKVSANTVINTLSTKKYNVIPVYITEEGKWLLYDGPFANLLNLDWDKFGVEAILSPDRTTKGLLRIVGETVRIIPVDTVFPVLHGINGEDGTIQGLCRLAGIPFVGCGVATSALAMDKHFTKIIAKNAGLKQAKYLTFKAADELEFDEIAKKIRYQLGYPCFIKPANTGSSIGISKARNKAELMKALEIAAYFSEKIVAEKAIIGRELECGVIGTGNDIKVSVVGEIVAAADFYDYDAKYNDNNSQTLVPADIPEEVSQEIQQSAKKIFVELGGHGFARVDFFWDEAANQVIFNEINTVPGFTPISMFAMMWAASGIPLDAVLDILVELAKIPHG